MVNKHRVAAVLACFSLFAQAGEQASVPFTPTWQSRHALQLLVDEAHLPITTSHWPLPSAAVVNALVALPASLPPHLELMRQTVLSDLRARQAAGHMSVQLRTRAESLVGFGQNYTPGSSLNYKGAAHQVDLGDASLAYTLGAKLEESTNSLQTRFSGWGKEGQFQARLDDAAAVVQYGGVNLQAFAHQNWWGVGWQSSLINGHNIPAWMGVGLQRAEVAPSSSPWLSWLGPWSLEAFVAQAQDPKVVANQPEGYLYTGMRLTFRPTQWAEVGVSRAIQFGGAGRRNDLNTYVKSLLGIDTNVTGDRVQDSGSQLAGFDLRLTCPRSFGCAVYTQLMGEDMNNNRTPLPTKYMSLFGVESTFGQGRYRAFAEYANTNMNSLRADNPLPLPGYLNGAYGQGYTNGGRWIGSAQGGGSKVWTLGLLDAHGQRQVKFHTGTIHTSVGAYVPRTNAPRGSMWAVSASQAFKVGGTFVLLPEMSYMHLDAGQSQRASKLSNLQLSLQLSARF